MAEKEIKKIEEVKQFSININNNDKMFTFSGPEGSSYNEIEGVAYKVMTEMVILKWKETIRLEAENKAKEESKDSSETEDK